MSDNENPIHAPSPPPRSPGRPVEGRQHRIGISVSISDPSSKFLAACVKQAQSVNPNANTGRLVDRLIDHAQQTGFRVHDK